MTDLATLTVNIKGDTSNLQSAMRKSEDQTSTFGSKLKGLGPLAAAGFAAVGIAAVAGAAKLVSMVDDANSATNRLQAQLGLTRQEAEGLGNVAQQVFRNNFGGSIAEASSALGTIRGQLGDLGTSGLQTATENAFRLRDAFGVDVAKSVDAVKTLMTNFGLSSTEAFDLVTAGFQKGLDRSGDFVESITEYSNQFANGGASAQQFFGLMESGLAGGVLGTDRAADAFKEFMVRIQDGSKLTTESLGSLGINAEELGRKLADGSMTGAEAFNLVLEKLNETEDSSLRMQAGVGLIGTQFEDLGQKGALGLKLTGDAFADVEGKAKDLDVQYESLGAVIETLKRKAIVDFLIPMGDKLLELINDVLPLLNGAIEGIGPVIDAAVEKIKTLWAELGPEFLATVEALRGHLETLVRFFREHWDQIGPIVLPVLQAIELVITTSLANMKQAILLGMNLIQGDWSAAWENVKTILSNSTDAWKTVLGLGVDALVAIVKALPGALLALQSEFNSALLSLGSALIDGITAGVRAAASRLAAAALEAITGALNAVKEKLSIFSPSGVTEEEIGVPMGQGIAAGIEKTGPQIAAALRNVTEVDEGGWTRSMLASTNTYRAPAALGVGGIARGQSDYGPAGPSSAGSMSMPGVEQLLAMILAGIDRLNARPSFGATY